MEAFDDCVEGRNLVPRFGFYEVQNGACIDKVGIEGVHGLEPGQIRVRSLKRWSRFDELIVLCGSTREQVGCRFLDVFRGVEGTVVPAKHEFVSPNT